MTNSSGPEQGEEFHPGVPVRAMDVLQTTVPQFTAFARVHTQWPTITVPDTPGSRLGKKISTDELREVGAFVEPAFFKIFDFTWLAGDPESALSQPNSVVLNKSMAVKCFGTWQEAVGKTVIQDNLVTLVVRGVVADPPPNSDFPFHVMVSYETVKKYPDTYNYSLDWGSLSSNDQVFAALGERGQLAGG